VRSPAITPDAAKDDHPYRALLTAVVACQANLIAHWLLIGFIHGVMNTDNTAISGETIDYGPCAFMDAYDPATVFSAIDRTARYTYGNQPRIAHWNLARPAATLLPLLAEDEASPVTVAQEVLVGFAPHFEAAYRDGLRRKIGLSAAHEEDASLAGDLLTLMANAGADFTVTFRALCDAAAGPEGHGAARAQFADVAAYDAWAERWRRRLSEEPGGSAARSLAMRAVNPAFIPRNHIVEAALNAAIDNQDFAPFEELLDVLSRPYEARPRFERYAAPPAPAE
jgi:uncharacterized protein YdiU (UPF0061 family)